MYTVISTTGDQTSDHRLQSQNSTTEPQSVSHTSDAKLTSQGNSIHNIDLIENIYSIDTIYLVDTIYLIDTPIGLVVRVFAKGPRDQGSILSRVIPKTQKWYLISHCLTLSIIRYISRVK